MRIRPVLVWLDCSCVWDTCRGAVCCGGCGRLTGRYSWQSLPQTLPLSAFCPCCHSWRTGVPLARCQDRVHQQQLGLPPSWVREQRCEGSEYGHNGIGQGEYGWALSVQSGVRPAYPVFILFLNDAPSLAGTATAAVIAIFVNRGSV